MNKEENKGTTPPSSGEVTGQKGQRYYWSGIFHPHATSIHDHPLLYTCDPPKEREQKQGPVTTETENWNYDGSSYQDEDVDQDERPWAAETNHRNLYTDPISQMNGKH